MWMSNRQRATFVLLVVGVPTIVVFLRYDDLSQNGNKHFVLGRQNILFSALRLDNARNSTPVDSSTALRSLGFQVDERPLTADERHALAGPGSKIPRWIVVTSVSKEPTEDTQRLATLKDWQLVVVGDLKTPLNWTAPESTLYLSVRVQTMLGYRISQVVPWKSYTRKNIGYLYAIRHGAEFIYDTDDDNRPFGPGLDGFDYTETVSGVRVAAGKLDTAGNSNSSGDLTRAQRELVLFQPYAAFGQHSMWPRGFPLDLIESHSNLNLTWRICGSAPRAAVQQGLVSGDPDVDAVYRLIHANAKKGGLDVTFDKHAPGVSLIPGLLSPWNSQNTLFAREAFFGLVLPTTVSFRTTDIWRSYFTQKLLHLAGLTVAFVPPNAVQKRNAHTYLDDFGDEDMVYKKAGSLVDFLVTWDCERSTMSECAIDLARAFAEHDFWKEEDAQLVEFWIEDLNAAEYRFPELLRFKTSTTSTTTTATTTTKNTVTRSATATTMKALPKPIVVPTWDHPDGDREAKDCRAVQLHFDVHEHRAARVIRAYEWLSSSFCAAAFRRNTTTTTTTTTTTSSPRNRNSTERLSTVTPTKPPTTTSSYKLGDWQELRFPSAQQVQDAWSAEHGSKAFMRRNMRTALVLTSNWPWRLGVIPFFDRLYGSLFGVVIYCGVFTKEVLAEAKAYAPRPLNILNMTDREVNGGYQMYVCMAKAAHLRLPNIDGYFTVADDATFTFWDDSFDLSRSVYDGMNHQLNGIWMRSEFGRQALDETLKEIDVIRRTRSDPILADFFVDFESRANKTVTDHFKDHGWGASDFFFVTAKDWPVFSRMANLMAKHRVFLEIAVVYIMEMLVEAYDLPRTLYIWGNRDHWPQHMFAAKLASLANVTITHPVKFTHFTSIPENGRHFCERFILQAHSALFT